MLGAFWTSFAQNFIKKKKKEKKKTGISCSAAIQKYIKILLFETGTIQSFWKVFNTIIKTENKTRENKLQFSFPEFYLFYLFIY